ncbi:MAG: hypothetical protein A2Z99_16445 [Treponema sp. GWB1_62_6]|nr:MAG: hypothetical protein A2001_10500 [Treponema sp. GWC1_61_84]OHE68891.1 MAG: hypothetical protein A2Z99_16445 [Treponema sp. GWB1_62_6]OHE72689.1 MAG: hypothetical protein A2413_12365 [Treponema sp. RIFOXYC1_FULL_61_9]HCM27752.1 hypothetical protein [Treponema sp.]
MLFIDTRSILSRVMQLSERQRSILKKLISTGALSIDKLKPLFPVSRETLRQDLLGLETLGLISRAYGEISFIDSPANGDFLQDLGWMTKTQRRERLLGLLAKHKELRISSLANRLNVTASTIRSDLDELEGEGLVVKKHGSVSLEAPTIPDPTVAETQSYPLKARILGQRGLFHINPNETIFLDGSPPSRFIAEGMPFHANIPIATNSLAVVDILRKRGYSSDILMLPGTVSIATGDVSVHGARSFFAQHGIRKAFISLRSYSNKTFYSDSESEAISAAEICEHAEKIFLFLDSITIDKKGEHEFPYRRYADKIQEIMIDDGLSKEEAALLFNRKDPIAICGLDFAYQNLSKRKYRIGFLVNKDKNYFIQAVYNGLQEAALAYKSTFLVIRETEGEYKAVLEGCSKIMEEKIDLLVDFTLCIDSMFHVGEKCRSRGIRLISVDLHIPGAVYFGADNSEAGRIAGEHASGFVTANWEGRLDRVIILGRHDIDPVTNLRISSAVETLQERVALPASAIKTIEWGDPERNPTQELIRELKDIPPEEKLLFIGFNLRHLLGAHDIIARHRMAEHTILVGQNYTQQIDELMKDPNSPIIGCVQYDPETYGERIMDLAQKMLENHQVQPINHTKHSWIPNPYRRQESNRAGNSIGRKEINPTRSG